MEHVQHCPGTDCGIKNGLKRKHMRKILDSTVSTRAVLDVLHHNLPDNGSELVLFDINRAVNFRALFRHSSDRALSHLLATPQRTYTTTIVKNVFILSEEAFLTIVVV